MKTSVMLSLAIATFAVASPAKRAKCGGGHHGSVYPHSSVSSAGYSASSGASYHAAVGTVCTTTATVSTSVTSTSTITSTPAAVTTTSFSTETDTTTETVEGNVATFTSTSTVFTTTTEEATSSVTATETDTVTVTSDTPTSTVAASPGFVPIQSVYGDNGRAQKRGLQARATKFDQHNLPTCTSTATESTTVTATSTATSNVEAPTPTSTQTFFTTVTSTSTVATDAETTTTTTVTEPVATTTTVTSTVATTTATSTSTEYVGPTPTAYAACSADNILSEYMGRGINSFNPDNGFEQIPALFASAADCCIACVNDSNCEGSAYVDGSCYVLTGGATCDPAASYGAFEATAESAFAELSNSNCGQWRLDSSN